MTFFISVICIALIVIVCVVVEETLKSVQPKKNVNESSSNAEQNNDSKADSPLVTDNKSHEIMKLDTRVITNINNEAVFSISIDGFIESFNGFYSQANGKSLLRSASKWTIFTYSSTPNSNYETQGYRFKQDEKNFIEPTITVYVPAHSNNIQEITLDFNDHGYTNWAYNLYEGYCFSALKVFFPDFDDNQIRELYKTLYSLTNDPSCFISDDAEPEPHVIFHHGDIGIYPYYSMGTAHICVVPATQSYLDDLAAKNVEIHDIDIEIS